MEVASPPLAGWLDHRSRGGDACPPGVAWEDRPARVSLKSMVAATARTWALLRLLFPRPRKSGLVFENWLGCGLRGYFPWNHRDTDFPFNTDCTRPSYHGLTRDLGYANTPHPIGAGRKLTQHGGCVRCSARLSCWIFCHSRGLGIKELRCAADCAVTCFVWRGLVSL